VHWTTTSGMGMGLHEDVQPQTQVKKRTGLWAGSVAGAGCGPLAHVPHPIEANLSHSVTDRATRGRCAPQLEPALRAGPGRDLGAYLLLLQQLQDSMKCVPAIRA
jgi:hypothetical protein